jgi:hypothetical protein
VRSLLEEKRSRATYHVGTEEEIATPTPRDA